MRGVGAALATAWLVSACTMVGTGGPTPTGPSGGNAGGDAAGRGAPDFRRDRPPSDPPPVDLDAIPDAEPRQEPRARSGNPREYEVMGRRYRTLQRSTGYDEEGVASWYGEEFHGRPTSSGEPYDMYAMSAAHRTLPLPTYVEVTNLDNGRRVVVRVNDRGPFHDDRLIDLSYAAAYRLRMIGTGTARVRVRAVGPESR